MRAPVAAQVRDCSLLLLKSISNVAATKKVQSLAFDKAVLPKRCKDQVDGRAALCIDDRTTTWSCNGGQPGANHLLPAK